MLSLHFFYKYSILPYSSTINKIPPHLVGRLTTSDWSVGGRGFTAGSEFKNATTCSCFFDMCSVLRGQNKGSFAVSKRVGNCIHGICSLLSAFHSLLTFLPYVLHQTHNNIALELPIYLKITHTSHSIVSVHVRHLVLLLHCSGMCVWGGGI